MKLKKLFILLILIQLYTCIYAQKQSDNWYFGEYAGLNFSTATPTVLLNSEMNVSEGCSSISDNDGNLLFYTNGITIWDKTHAIMQNGTGLLGSITSAQSALILQKPENNNIYYVFTTAENGDAEGLNYSEIDMNLNGGLGAVTTNKNINLLSNSNEQVTATLHENSTDIWVISYQCDNTQFFSFKISSSGVSSTPIISNYGTSHGCSLGSNGCMKASPNGTKIARAVNHSSLVNKRVEIFNFNKSTGEVSSPIVSILSPDKFYGLEFSPNSQLLYVSSNNLGIKQFNLSSGLSPSILASETFINNSTGIGTSWSLQLARNGKIYIAQFNRDKLSVINDPNTPGNGCNYSPLSVDLGGTRSKLGLPPFITSYFLLSDYEFSQTCYGDSTEFISDFNMTPDSIKWDFGDLNTQNDTSSIENPKYLYSDTGEFTCTLYAWLNGVSDTVVKTININGKFITPISDQVICNNMPVTVNAAVIGATEYIWNEDISQNNSSYTITDASDNIFVDVTLNGCTERDSIAVSEVNVSVSLGNDTTLCPNESILLNGTTQDASYTWNNQSNQPTQLIVEPGTYSLEVTVDQCSSIDYITVNHFNTPGTLDLGNDQVLCNENDKTTIASNIQNVYYYWSNGSTTESISTTVPGNYSVTITDFNGCFQTDNINVSLNVPKINLGENQTLCATNKTTLAVQSGFQSYLWNTNQTSNSISINNSGEYTVTITDENNCQATDSVKVTFEHCSIFFPSAFTPTNDGLNDVFMPKARNIKDYQLLIYNRFGELIFESKDLSLGWDGTYKGELVQNGVYNYVAKYKGSINLNEQSIRDKVVLIK